MREVLCLLYVWREWGKLGPVWRPGWAWAVGRMAHRPAVWGDPGWDVLSAKP